MGGAGHDEGQKGGQQSPGRSGQGQQGGQQAGGKQGNFGGGQNQDDMEDDDLGAGNAQTGGRDAAARIANSYTLFFSALSTDVMRRAHFFTSETLDRIYK